MHIQHHGGKPIRLLDTQRLHRQRKGRRKTVTVMDHEELAAHFSVEPHQIETLKSALIVRSTRCRVHYQKQWANSVKMP